MPALPPSTAPRTGAALTGGVDCNVQARHLAALFCARSQGARSIRSTGRLAGGDLQPVKPPEAARIGAGGPIRIRKEFLKFVACSAALSGVPEELAGLDPAAAVQRAADIGRP